MDQLPLGTEVSLVPVRWHPAPPRKEAVQQPPHFSAHVYCDQAVAHLSNCWALDLTKFFTRDMIWYACGMASQTWQSVGFNSAVWWAGNSALSQWNLHSSPSPSNVRNSNKCICRVTIPFRINTYATAGKRITLIAPQHVIWNISINIIMRGVWLTKIRNISFKNRMWAKAQRDGRSAEYRWRPLFNAATFGWRPLLSTIEYTVQ